MTLATQGLLTFPGAMALVLGENIGTTITAELATIGSTNINAHRAARAHTMFNVIGVTFMLIIFPYFIDFIKFVTTFPGQGLSTKSSKGMCSISPAISPMDTLCSMSSTERFFLIFLPLLIKVAILLSPKEDSPEDVYRLPNFGTNSMIRRSPLWPRRGVKSKDV